MPTNIGFADSFCTPPCERAGYRIWITPPTSSMHWSIDNAFVGGHRTESSVEIYKRELSRKLIAGGCTRYFNPSTHEMCGMLGAEELFARRIDLGRDDIFVLRPTVSAEGLVVPEKCGVLITSGGCAVIVVSGTNDRNESVCIVAHAGLKSLIDPTGVRKHGIVEQMVTEAIRRGLAPETITLRSFFEIPWRAFRFPTNTGEFREENQRLIAYLHTQYPHVSIVRGYHVKDCIDLGSLIREQARRMGVGRIDTLSHTLPLDGRYAYTRHSSQTLSGNARNLVLLARK